MRKFLNLLSENRNSVEKIRRTALAPMRVKRINLCSSAVIERRKIKMSKNIPNTKKRFNVLTSAQLDQTRLNLTEHDYDQYNLQNDLELVPQIKNRLKSLLMLRKK